VRYRIQRLPHCTTGPNPAGSVTVHGSGQATLAQVAIPESIPSHFTAGDIITLMGQPQKRGAGALFEVIVFLVYVPNTSGQAPP
jgi:hypothetical protein